MNSKNENESLINIFLEEAEGLLNEISATLQVWESDLNNKKYCVDLKRDLHTLKGGAMMVNQLPLSMLARELESLCEMVLSGNVVMDRSNYHLICDKRDNMKKILQSLSQEKTSLQMGVDKIASMGHKKPIILVVDDSLTIRTVTKHFLENNHYQVVTAEDGFDAIQQLKNVKPDVILLDVEMPRMDGFQFVKKIHEMPLFSKIPIIMITFCIGEEQTNQAKKLGIEKLMSKPYQESDLLEAIKGLISLPPSL